MSAYSVTLGLPCCHSAKGYEPLPLRTFRTFAIALGVIALIGGILALLNVSPFSQLSFPLKWAAIGIGGGVTLLSLFLKCIRKWTSFETIEHSEPVISISETPSQYDQQVKLKTRLLSELSSDDPLQTTTTFTPEYSIMKTTQQIAIKARCMQQEDIKIIHGEQHFGVYFPRYTFSNGKWQIDPQEDYCLLVFPYSDSFTKDRLKQFRFVSVRDNSGFMIP